MLSKLVPKLPQKLPNEPKKEVDMEINIVLRGSIFKTIKGSAVEEEYEVTVSGTNDAEGTAEAASNAVKKLKEDAK